MRSLLLGLFTVLLFVACGSGAAPDPADQGTGGSPGSGGSPGGGGGTGTPPPAPAPFVFDDATISLGKAGAFPSDLVAASDGTLLTVDDAAIPANVVAYSSATLNPAPLYTVPITASDLIDHDGTRPARAPTAFGTGLFGAFTGDLELAFDRWLLVTVSAGNSLSDDGSAPLHLANLVVIDTQSRRIVQTVNLGWPLPFRGFFNHGGPFDTIPQSLPSMVAFVPDRKGTPTGRVYVAMSNGAGTNAGLQAFFNGTVQSWTADFTQSVPLGIDTTGKAPADATRTFVSKHFNPVGLTRFTNVDGFSTLILTDAGASRFDASFNALPVSDAVLEFLDLDSGQWREAWTASLGPILPAPQAIALGRDGSGEVFGVIGSQTYAAAYVLDLEGLDRNPVDPARLGLLHTVALAPGGPVTPGSGFQPGVAVSASGRTALLSSFTTAGLRVLALPDDIRFGAVVSDPAPFAASALGPVRGLGLGALVVPPAGLADAVFVVNGDFDAGFVPRRSAHLGTLRVTGSLP